MTIPPPFTTRFARMAAALLAVVPFLTASAALATVPVATVDLSGATFGKDLEVHLTSGTQTLAAAKSYAYNLEGSVHGTGLLAAILPAGTKLSDLLEQLQPGSASTLVGSVSNANGTLPFKVIKRSYSGDVPIPGTPFSASASITLIGKITATGLIRFDVTNVDFSLPLISDVGTVVFEPGSKLTVGVSPVIDFKSATATVAENAGSVSLIVKRKLNRAGQVTVHYETADGTANGADYETASGDLTFNNGETVKTVVVNLLNRPEAQGSRRFRVRLSAPGGGAILGSKPRTVVTINDAP